MTYNRLSSSDRPSFQSNRDAWDAGGNLTPCGMGPLRVQMVVSQGEHTGVQSWPQQGVTDRPKRSRGEGK